MKKQKIFFFVGIVFFIECSFVFGGVSVMAPKFVLTQKNKSMIATGGVQVIKENIVLTGKDIVYNQAQKSLWINGNVLLKQKGLIMTSHKIGSEDQFKTILSVGDVEVKYKGLFASAQKAQYFINNKQVVLSIDPYARQNEDIVVGDKIIVDLAQEKLLSTGKARVKISSKTLENDPQTQ